MFILAYTYNLIVERTSTSVLRSAVAVGFVPNREGDVHMSIRSMTHTRSALCCKLQVAALAFGLLATAPSAGFADTYFTANFTFGVFGGNANQQPPFQGVVAPFPAGGTFTGSLVFDQSLVPGPGSGFVNVFFSSFPDIAQIPPATALDLPLGSLPPFTLADAVTQFGSQEAAIQYNNGAFNGLFYISDFTFNGNPYELQIQGGSLSIVPIVNGNPTFNSLVNGFVQGPLFNVQPFTPVAPGVPEPSTWAIMLIGFAGIGFAFRKSRRKMSFA